MSCLYCNGWGYITGPGASVPYGSTYVSLPDEVEPCKHCLDKGLCPKCLEPIEESKSGDGDDLHCLACGWKDGDEGEEQEDWDEPDIDWEY